MFSGQFEPSLICLPAMRSDLKYKSVKCLHLAICARLRVHGPCKGAISKSSSAVISGNRKRFKDGTDWGYKKIAKRADVISDGSSGWTEDALCKKIVRSVLVLLFSLRWAKNIQGVLVS